MVSVRQLSILLLMMFCMVLLPACGGDDELSGDADLDKVIASGPVRAAWEAQQIRLFEPRVVAPREAEIRLYFQLREALFDPKRRQAAIDRFFLVWDADPHNALWAELASAKSHLIGHGDTIDRMMVAAAGADTAAAVYHFVRGRKLWGRDPAAHEYFRHAAATASRGSLLGVWSQLRLARIECDAGHTETGIRLLVGSLPDAWKVGGPPLAGIVWQELSQLTRNRGRLGDALLAAYAAEACAGAIGDGFTRTIARLAIGRAHRARKEFPAAYDTFISCATVAKDSSYFRLQKSAIGRMAQMARYSADYEQEQAHMLAVHSVTGAAEDTLGLIRARIAVASCERRRGHWQEAEDWFVRAHEANSAWNFYDLGIDIDREHASLFAQQGNYAAAESLRSAGNYKNENDWYGQGALESWIDLVAHGLETDRPDLAYHALAEARKIPLGPMQPSASYDPVLQLESVAARFHARQGELQLADTALARARIRRPDATPDAAWYLYQAEGLVATEAGDKEAAWRAYTTCEDLAQKTGNPDLIRRSHLQIGAHLLAKGSYAAAESLFHSDLNAPEYWTKLNARLLTGMCRSRSGNPLAALSVFASVDSLLGPNAPRDLNSRLRLEQGRALAALDRPREALRRLQESKQSHSQEKMVNATNIGQSFNVLIEREIAEEVLILLFANPDFLSGEERLTRSFEIAAWGRSSSQSGNRTLEKSALKKAVANRNTRIEFFVGRYHAYMWIFGPEGATPLWRALPAPQQLADLANAVETDMSYPGRDIDHVAAAQLGHQLLQPAMQFWDEDTTLEILADGPLTGLPWAALPVNKNAVSGPAISWGSLVLVAGTSTQAERKASTALLVLGTNGDADPTSKMVLTRAEAEAVTVANLWPDHVDLRLGDDARWAELRTGGSAGYKAIHIASHTRVYEGADGRSTIHMAGLATDTPLTVQGIPELQADAELIYLSSCEGGRRHRSAGRGVTSFAEAFLSAGAGSVVASSILVDDQAAAALAAAFYRHWLTGKQRAAALRAALLEVRNADPKWEHPFYWAFTNLYQPG